MTKIKIFLENCNYLTSTYYSNEDTVQFLGLYNDTRQYNNRYTNILFTVYPMCN